MLDMYVVCACVGRNFRELKTVWQSTPDSITELLMSVYADDTQH